MTFQKLSYIILHYIKIAYMNASNTTSMQLDCLVNNKYKKMKKDTVLSFNIDGVIQQVLFFQLNCLIFNN